MHFRSDLKKFRGSDNFFSKKCATLSLYQNQGKYTRFHISADMINYYAQVITFLRHAMYFLRPLKCAEINFRCPAEKIAGSQDIFSV